MDAALRRAWTTIVIPDDYEQHMASIGQAQAAARLTTQIIAWAQLTPGSRITVAGAGTGQMLDHLDAAGLSAISPGLLRPELRFSGSFKCSSENARARSPSRRG